MRTDPLLEVKRGRSPGSPLSAALRRRALGAGLGLVVLATAALLLLQRSGDGGGEGLSDIGSGSLDTLALHQPRGGQGSGGSGDDPISAAAAAAAAAAGGTSAADEQSLAAAQRRARKAAALPLPEHRTHAEGLALSPGAAEAAAACRGERCELLTRFLLAVEEAGRLAEAGGLAVQHCPDALGVGMRPLPYTPHAWGNRCEPLWTRGALEVVHQLAAPDWRGLEWLTGGSTAWLLTRIGHLTSIESAAAFAAKTRQVAEAQFDAAWLREHWELRLVPTGGAPGPPRTFADLESEERYADYCAAAFLPDDAQLDIVAVHGFARMACLRRAVQLLRPQGGLLVLPQAQRPAYRAAAALVPPHWLRLTDSHDLGQTIVWMSMRKA